MDSLKLPKGSSATSSASGSNSNLSGSASTSAVGSLATSPTSTVPPNIPTAIKTPPGLSSSTPISVRFNANEESLDDILQSFHHNSHQHSHSPIGGGGNGGGDISPTMLGLKNNGSVGDALGMLVNPCDTHSLSSSPSQQHQQQQQQHQHQQQQQHHLQQQQQQQLLQQQASLFGNEEVTLRNSFLQGGGGVGSGGFFNRKRSGSIEGVSPTSSGPNLLTALTTGSGAADSTNATVGTWKLIKGKVSQTIEEIKSSKHHSQQASAIPIIVANEPTTISTVGWTNEPDADIECITINTTIQSEEQQHNSDSDLDIELIDSISLGSAEIGAAAAISTEGSRLRRGLAHIKSKVKAKQQAAAMTKKDQSSGASSNPSTSLRNRLRRRNNPTTAELNTEPSTSAQAEVNEVQENESAPEISGASGKSKRGILLARKDVEIESGVEVLEDMMPESSTKNDTAADADLREGVHFNDVNSFRSRSNMELALEGSSTVTHPRGRSPTNGIPLNNTFGRSLVSMWSNVSWRSMDWHTTSFAQPLLLGAGTIALVVLPMPDFVRGVVATILFIMTMNYCSAYIGHLFETYVLRTFPEHRPFQIPNYSNMPICEIPSALEHKTIKTYSGWLMEIDSYDPSTFSFNMTKAIYARLDGTILKLSSTSNRIPKRRMWNEKPIDRAKILFNDHRSYDLRDCRIELLPVGLARKRFFNRKYPIQLIIKKSYSGYSTPGEEQDEISTGGAATPATVEENEKTADFGMTVVYADLSKLRNTVTPDLELKEITIPCGDEVRLLVFARCDREKEDWYRRFHAASKGRVHESDLQVPMAQFIDDTDLQSAAAQQAINLTMGANKTRIKDAEESSLNSIQAEETGTNTPENFEELLEEDTAADPKDGYEGLIMSADVARNPAEYVKFMTVYQKACKQNNIPVYRRTGKDDQSPGSRRRKHRRSRRQENELWKGIDQSLFLGPSGSVVWANVVMGRCLYSWLHDPEFQIKIQDFMQKKLNSIKLPSFMEEVIITNIYLGESPMLFHRISQPMLDERGIWLDADMTYEGLAHITVTTKVNLLRVRSKPKASPVNPDAAPMPPETPLDARSVPDDVTLDTNPAIYDSDAESSGGSSTESDSAPADATSENANSTEFFQNSPGNARRIFKIVDRIATSNLFQYASELPYVQRAMENMNANITLRVDLKGLVARGTLNIPPPPSDRIWLCFRGPPRLWISTKPQVGDKSVDWSIVTNVIESKLCEAVNKFLVFPNMVDFSVAFLSKPNYDEESGTSN